MSSLMAMHALGLTMPLTIRSGLMTAFRPPRRLSKKMIDPMEHCTGIEKRERSAHQVGITDPFGIEPIERGPGTKECPNLIPSAFEARIVGCICHPDQRFAQWMWLIKDMPKRCECGYWFKLVEVPAF